MKAAKVVNIIFDGDCGFCRRSLRFIEALDLRRVLRFYDSRQPETVEHFPVLRGADVEEAMYAVVAGEPVYRGFFAFRRLLWSNPSTWLLIPIFYFPGARFLGPRVYAWVARNRNKLGCRTTICDLTSPRI